MCKMGEFGAQTLRRRVLHRDTAASAARRPRLPGRASLLVAVCACLPPARCFRFEFNLIAFAAECGRAVEVVSAANCEPN